MDTVLYQWKIEPIEHDEFIDAWEAITEHFITYHSGLGSRLRHVKDNLFTAYAQWPCKLQCDSALAANNAPADVFQSMPSCITERLLPIEMSVVSDKLISSLQAQQ